MEHTKKYIITLDDDPTVSKFIARATGITSIPFAKSKSLVARAHSYKPVAAFIDVHLDEADCGLDVISELRSLWAWTTIIVITAGSNQDHIGQALALGANDFIRKEKYLKVVEEYCQKNPAYHGKFPELKRKFTACTTKQELEDLYLPFKPKRRTKAQVAKENLKSLFGAAALAR